MRVNLPQLSKTFATRCQGLLSPTTPTTACARLLYSRALVRLVPARSARDWRAGRVFSMFSSSSSQVEWGLPGGAALWVSLRMEFCYVVAGVGRREGGQRNDSSWCSRSCIEGKPQPAPTLTQQRALSDLLAPTAEESSAYAPEAAGRTKDTVLMFGDQDQLKAVTVVERKGTA